MEDHINEEYLKIGHKYMNVKESNNFLDMKQEVVLESTLITGKRRYLQKIIMEKGKPTLDFNIKGLEIKKSNLNDSYKSLGTKLVHLLLDYGSKDESDALIRDFVETLASRDMKTISKRSTVKDMEKGILKDEHGILTYGKSDGVPSHVRSAVNYNNFITQNKLENKFRYITSGSKVYYFWLLTNPWGIENIAIPESTPPEEITEFIQKYIDVERLFETEIRKKILVLYDAVNWELNLNEGLTFEDLEEW